MGTIPNRPDYNVVIPSFFSRKSHGSLDFLAITWNIGTPMPVPVKYPQKPVNCE